MRAIEPARQHPRLRYGRMAIHTIAPVPHLPGRFELLNVHGRPIGRMSDTPIEGRHVGERDLDLRFARPRMDGAWLIFDESDAPWVSVASERAYQRRIALVMQWRKPTRADLARVAAAWRRVWAAVGTRSRSPRQRDDVRRLPEVVHTLRETVGSPRGSIFQGAARRRGPFA